MIIGVLNQKGGAGKTTLSVGLAACLTRKGSKVLLGDVDPQGSAMNWQAARNGDILFPVVSLVRRGERRDDDIFRPTIHKNIGQISAGYDHVILDGAPRVTALARSVIMASDVILIPVQPSPYDIWASEEVIELIEEASVYKPNLKRFFVVNRKKEGTVIGRDIGQTLAAYPVPVFDKYLCDRVVFAEAVISGLDVSEMKSGKPAAIEVEAVTDELLEKMQ